MPGPRWRAAICMLPLWSLTFLLPALAAPTETLGTGSSAHSKNSSFVHRALNRVEGSYFVHMKDGTSWQKVEEIVEELGRLDRDPSLVNFTAQVQGLLTQAAFGFPAQLSEEALQKVLEYGEVSFVQEDQYIKTGTTSPPRPTQSWGLDRLDQTSSAPDNIFHQPCNLTGLGVDVYVMDTGVSYDHREFGGRARYPGCDLIDSAYQGRDCVGHGTHVAGVVGGLQNGVAPSVEIFSVRVINCEGKGSSVTVVNGIECILNRTQHRRRPAIVNMSLFTSRNRMIKRAVEMLLKRGITVVTIAGNTDNKPRDSCKYTPSSVHGVITAAASTDTNGVHQKSNAGSCVDIYAPGKDVLTASTACVFCMDRVSGTSIAAPFVSGAAALLLQKCPSLPPWKVKHHVMSHLSVADELDMTAVPLRLRRQTPNLLLHLSSQMCSIPC